jgi:hypothetical protein
MVLAVHPSKSSPPVSPSPGSISAFSTSTPTRSRSPRPSLSFSRVSPSPGPPSSSLEPQQGRHPHAPPLQAQSGEALALEEEDLERRESDFLVSARVYLEAKEFMRAIWLLRTCKSAKGTFIRTYALFMVCVISSLVRRLVSKDLSGGGKESSSRLAQT